MYIDSARSNQAGSVHEDGAPTTTAKPAQGRSWHIVPNWLTMVMSSSFSEMRMAIASKLGAILLEGHATQSCKGRLTSGDMVAHMMPARRRKGASALGNACHGIQQKLGHCHHWHQSTALHHQVLALVRHGKKGKEEAQERELEP